MTTTETLRKADIKHRRDFAKYATRESSSDGKRPILERLYAVWDSINNDHFEGKSIEPAIMLGEPSSPRSLGECSHEGM
jgi:hypothetical protein